MTNEERDLIARFVARVGGAPQSGSFLGGSVPNSASPATPALPAIDREANSFIAQQFQQYPEAQYRMTQMALVQEAALGEAQNRIQRLQWELEQSRQAMQQAPQQKGGFFSSIFGGGSSPAPQQMQRQAAPQGQQQGGPWGQQQGAPQGQQQGYGYSNAPPQPQYAPNYQPGMFQRSGGSGFLGTALTTAAGVAGGMVVGNALMGAFGGHGGSTGSSWASPMADASGASPFDGAGTAVADAGGDGGFAQNSGFSDPFGGAGTDGTQSSGWDQASGGGFDGGGFDGGGGGGGFDDQA